MTRLVAGADAAACKDIGFREAMTTTACNWTVPQVTHIFETFIAPLGISAARWGAWLEQAGLRKAGFVIAAVRESQLAAGVAKSLVYDRTLYIMAGRLLLGLICNLMIRSVKASACMSDAELERERALQHEKRVVGNVDSAARGAFGFGGTLAWLAVGVPFLIGPVIALQKAAALF